MNERIHDLSEWRRAMATSGATSGLSKDDDLAPGAADAGTPAEKTKGADDVSPSPPAPTG